MEFSSITRKKLGESEWFLILANLLPVYGVWFLGWNARQIFLVYCLETIIIGLFTLVKLGIATAVRKKDWWENQSGNKSLVHGGFFMLFFLLHYGLFVGIQVSIFVGTSSIGGNSMPAVLDLLLHPGHYIGTEGWLLFSVFIFSYGYESLVGFIFRNEYMTKSFDRIMFEPYIRIFIQQFVVILGGMFLALGGGKFFILIFAATKIFFTVFLDYDRLIKKPHRA